MTNIDLSMINSAIKYYENKGFLLHSVPLLVDPDIMSWTCPTGAKDIRMTHVNGKQYVASAEQSFLQLEKEGKISSHCMLQAITPCWRDEYVLDDTHLTLFLKLELFVYKPLDNHRPYRLAQVMKELLTKLDIEATIEPTSMGYDVVSSGVELGSFGYRESPKGILYLYGTGLAEPRTSYVKNLVG